MKNRFCEPLILLCVVGGCGVQDAPIISTPQPTNRVAGPDEQSLGIGNAGSSNYGSLQVAVGPNLVARGQLESIGSYVRFKRPNGVECSGVLAYEPTSENVPSSGHVDVYLYTALHCFEETDPFGNPKSADTNISSAYRYKTATATSSGVNAATATATSNPVLSNLAAAAQQFSNSIMVTAADNTALLADKRVVHVLSNNGIKSDIARVWQLRAPVSEVNKKILPVCASKPGEGSRIQTFGFGTDVDYKLNYSNSVTSSSGSSLSFGVSARVGKAEFEVKQVGMALGQYLNEPSRALTERLGLLFANVSQLNISPYIMRMGGTSSQPGESGSPVFSVRMNPGKFSCPAGGTFCLPNQKITIPFNEDELSQPRNIAEWNCLAGVLSREVAQRAGNSSTLEWDTFYSPFLEASTRTWSAFSGESSAVPQDLLGSRTFSTLQNQHVSTNPLGDMTTQYGQNVSGAQTLTTCFGTLCPNNGSAGTQVTSSAATSSAATSSVATANSTVPVVKTVSSRSRNLNAERLFGSSVFKSTTPKEIIISENVVVTSSSTSSPALLIPAGGGGVIKITNKGKIIGKGGSSGAKGGDALVVRSPATLTNTGLIAGGGGGGGVGGQGGLGGLGGMGVTTRGVKVTGGAGGVGGAGGSGGKGADEIAAVDGYTGRSGRAGRSVRGAGRGGTGGTGGKGGLGGALGENGSNGQTGGTGGHGGNGNFSNGAAGRSGLAGGAGGVAGFAINGSSLLEGRLKIGGACADVSSSYGELKGRRNALMSSGDALVYVCK